MQRSLGVTPINWRSREAFALASFIIWTLGATAARWIGIWPGVGGAAVTLGFLALALHRHALLEQLRPSAKLVAIGLASSIIMVSLTYLLYPLASMLPVGIPAQTGLLYQTFRHATPLVTLTLLPLCVIAEELIWRGMVQEALTRRCGVMGGALLAAAAYAAAHVPTGSGLLPVVGLLCGIFWGLLRAGSKSLVPPLICHMVWDVIVFSVFPLVQ